jgi:hypothetical protein
MPTPPVELFAALIAADSGTMAQAKEAPLGTPNCHVENWWGSLPIGIGKIVSLNKAQQDADPQGKALTGFLDLRCRLTACFARDACKGQQPERRAGSASGPSPQAYGPRRGVATDRNSQLQRNHNE